MPDRVAAARLGMLDNPQGQLLTCVALFALFVVMGHLSTGTLTDDDIGRFLSVQAVFDFPEKILGLWTRPLFMLLYALPARLGYGAVEVITALVSATACWLSVRSAARLGECHPAWAAFFLGFQPMFLLLSFSALTEPLAALLLIASIERLLAGRLLSSALMAALIPLARLELLPILVLLGLYYAARRSWRSILVLPTGLLAWNLAGWIVSGEPLFLLDRVFIERNRDVQALGALHYPLGFIHAVGPVVFFFAILGLVDALRLRRYAILTISFLVMFLYYTLSASLSGSLQSAGYLRHLVTIAPLVAVVAVRGWSVWIVEPPRIWVTLLALSLPVLAWVFLSRELQNGYIVGTVPEHLKFAILLVLALLGLFPWFARSFLMKSGAQIAIVAVVLASAVGYVFAKHGPLPLNSEHQVMRDAAAWCTERGLVDRTVLCNNVTFHFFAERNPSYEDRYPRLTTESLAAAPVSSVVIWDGHYGHELAGGIELHQIELDPNLRVLRRFLAADRSFFAVALEKVNDGTTRPFDLVAQTYRHHGFSVEWQLPRGEGWRLDPVDEGTNLIRGVLPSEASRQTTPTNKSEVPSLSLELGITRFLREWRDPRTNSATLETDLRERHGMTVLRVSQGSSDDWIWIECTSNEADLLVGTILSPGRDAALNVVGAGPQGSLASLRAAIPSLVRDLHFVDPAKP